MAVVWKEIKMTSNNSPSPYVAKASSEYSSTYRAYLAFSGSQKTNPSSDCWATAMNAPLGWLLLDMGTPTRINVYSVSPRDIYSGGNYYGSAPRTWRLMGSNDGVNFDLVHRVENETKWSSTNHNIVYTIEDAHEYRYWRINIEANNGYNGYTCIGQLRFGYDVETDKKLRMVVENTATNKLYSIDTATSTLIEIINGTSEDIAQYGMKDRLTYEFDSVSFTKLKTITRLNDGNVNVVDSSIPITSLNRYIGESPTLLFYNEDVKDVIVESIVDEYRFLDGIDDLTVNYSTTSTKIPKLKITANYSPLDELNGDIKLLSWSENTEDLIAEVTKKNMESIITPLSDIITLGIDKYNKFEVTSVGDVKFAFSVDRGLTYHALINGVWTAVNDASEGMNVSVLSLITDDDMKALQGTSDYLRIQYSLYGDLAKLDNIKLMATFLDSEKLASTNKYDLEYDMLNKTINIDFKVAGTYSISYMDSN